MAITVTSKYKPFTYEELVKPLESYWEKYDKQEEALQQDLNSLAQLKAIVDKAPEDNIDRQNFYTLYNKFKNSVNSLAESGLSFNLKNQLKDLRQEYNAQIPRILKAEEDFRKANQEFMKLQNSGKYIIPNNNNPGSFDWTNYLDGNIPAFDPALSKQEILNNAKEYSAKISAKVTHKPDINSNALPGYSSITQKQGLKFDNPEEMLANPIMKNAYDNILSQYNTEGWDDVSKEALENNIKTGMFEGLYYDEKVDYHKHQKADTNPISKFLEKNQVKLFEKQLELDGLKNKGEDVTTSGYKVIVDPASASLKVENKAGVTMPYHKDKEKQFETDRKLRLLDNWMLNPIGVGRWDHNGTNTGGWYGLDLSSKDVEKDISNNKAMELLDYKHFKNTGTESSYYIRPLAKWQDKAYNFISPEYHTQVGQDEKDIKLFKSYVSPNDFITYLVGAPDDNDDNYRVFIMPITALVNTYADKKDPENFLASMKPVISEIRSSYRAEGAQSKYAMVSTKLDQAVVAKFTNQILPSLLSKCNFPLTKEGQPLEPVSEESIIAYKKIKENILKDANITNDSKGYDAIYKEISDIFAEIENTYNIKEEVLELSKPAYDKTEQQNLVNQILSGYGVVSSGTIPDGNNKK